MNIQTNTFRAVLLSATTLLLFVCACSSVFAQEKKEGKYWTIENNVKDKTYTIIRFYANNDELVYERKVKKKFIKLNRKDIRRLNKELVKFNLGIKRGNYLAHMRHL